MEKSRAPLPDNFPEGMRVLLVDDDLTCLKVIERLLKFCTYEVTTCSSAAKALSLLRQNRGAFDLIISDVYMPDMDGFKLLEIVGLEMDIPVIMMSADASFDIVSKGIIHGACGFLVKPVRIFELQNIWQHVARRYMSEHKETDHSGTIDEAEGNKQANIVPGIDNAVDVVNKGSTRYQKKKRDGKEEDDGESDNANSSSKKPRVVWTVYLHQKFMNAVNQIGFDKAVPKRILELMNEPGLTRGHVASHLQKFRLYLKKVCYSQQVALANSLRGTSSNANMGQLGGLDIGTLAVPAEISPQILAQLQDELLGHSSFDLATPVRNQSALQLSNLERGTLFSQSGQSGKGISSFPSWSSNSFAAMGSSSNFVVSNTSHTNNVAMSMLQQHQNSQLFQSELPNLIDIHSPLLAPDISLDDIQIRQGPLFSVQDPHAPASQALTNFPTGNNVGLMNQGPVGVESQSLTSCSLKKNPLLLNQSQAILPAQASMDLQIRRRGFMLGPSQSPSLQKADYLLDDTNNHGSAGARGTMNYSHFSSHVSAPSNMGQFLGGSFRNGALSNAIPISMTSLRTSSIDGSNSRQEKSSYENIGLPNGSISINSSNIQTDVSMLTNFPDQHQGRSLDSVGKASFLKSQLAKDAVDSTTNDSTDSSRSTEFLLNQDASE